MTPSGVFLSLSLENFIRKRLLCGEKPGRSNMNMNKIFIQKWDNYVAGNHRSRKSIKKTLISSQSWTRHFETNHISSFWRWNNYWCQVVILLMDDFKKSLWNWWMHGRLNIRWLFGHFFTMQMKREVVQFRDFNQLIY